MNYEHYIPKIKVKNIAEKLDKNLSILGIFLSIILIFYLYVEIHRPIYVLVGIFTLISCIIWLLIREGTPMYFDLPKSQPIYLSSSILFFLLLIFSIFSVYFRSNLYERPITYFILTSLMAGLVALEIIFCSNKKKLILMQIIILGFSISSSQFLIFPNIVGFDNWWHQMFVIKIINMHSIPLNDGYSKLPIFHLIICITSFLTELKYKSSGTISICLIGIICESLFVFLISRAVHNDYKVGLFAPLFVVIAPNCIGMNSCWMPTGLAGIFMLIIIYLFLKLRPKLNLNDKSYAVAILLIIFMVTLNITHPLASLSMAIILFVFWASLKFYTKFYSISNILNSLTRPILFSTIMVAWWTFASGHIETLSNLLAWGFHFDKVYSVPEESQKYLVSAPFTEQVLNNVGLFIFFTFSFIGLFYMLSRGANDSSFCLATGAFFTLAIGFFSLITGYYLFQNRWYYFSQLLLGIPLAIAALLLIERNNNKKTVFNLSLPFIFISLFAFLLIISTQANIDNDIFSPTLKVRCTFTESEIIGSNFIAKKAVGNISSDFDYCGNPSSSIFSNYYNISSKRLFAMDGSLVTGRFEDDGSIKIVRDVIISKPFRITGGLYRINYDPNVAISNSGFNKIYQNSGISAYKGD